MKGVFSNSNLKMVGLALVTLAVINNVPQLGKVKKTINGDTGWF